MNTVSADFGRRGVLGTSALLFAVSATLTVHASRSMSMAWMRMPTQSWSGAAATFLVMWVAMMVAMMLPSLLAMLLRYRRSVGRIAETRLGPLTALVGAGYFTVWSVIGIAAFGLSVALTAMEERVPEVARAVPFAQALLVLLAGGLQFTAWKARHLACCRSIPGQYRTLAAGAGTAWGFGLRCGLHCSYCCAGLTAMLFGLGVMDLRAMMGVATAITLERLAPQGASLVRAIGMVVIGLGLFLLVRATGL